MLCCLPSSITHTPAHTTHNVHIFGHIYLDAGRIMAGSKLLFQLCHFFVPRFCESAWPQVRNTQWSLVCSPKPSVASYVHTLSYTILFFRQFCTSLGLQFPYDLLVRSLLTSFSSCFVVFCVLLLTQQNCVQAEGTYTYRYNPVCLVHRYVTSLS